MSYRADVGARISDLFQEVCDMTIVRRASPLGELISLRHAMDRLFEDSFVRPGAWSADRAETFGLPLDVINDTDALVVEAALPGVKPDDVEITVEDGTLSIRAESQSDVESGEGETLIREIRRGSVARVIALPTGLEPDKATATFEHGMLTLRIPRAEAVKPRQIRISPTTDGHIEQGSTAPAEAGTSIDETVPA
jgi:HSP20 family protein